MRRVGHREQAVGERKRRRIVGPGQPGDGQAAPGRAAEQLLARGASLDWVPAYAHGTPLDAASSPGTRKENVITWLRELGAPSATAFD